MKLLSSANNFTRKSPTVPIDPYANLSHSVDPAVLRFPGRGRTAFCRPVSSRALGSHPVGPYGVPDRWEHSLQKIRKFWSLESNLSTPPSSLNFNLINRWLAAACSFSTLTTCSPRTCSVSWFYNNVIPFSFHLLFHFFGFFLLLVYLRLGYSFRKVVGKFPIDFNCVQCKSEWLAVN